MGTVWAEETDCNSRIEEERSISRCFGEREEAT
jgi:hypothetical protein